MWFFTALFGGLILLSVESRRRMIAIMLIGCIAVLGVAPPPEEECHDLVAEQTSYQCRRGPVLRVCLIEGPGLSCGYTLSTRCFGNFRPRKASIL